MKNEKLWCGRGPATFIFWGALFLVFLCKGREVLADYISSASRLAGATADAVAVMIALSIAKGK